MYLRFFTREGLRRANNLLRQNYNCNFWPGVGHSKNNIIRISFFYWATVSMFWELSLISPRPACDLQTHLIVCESVAFWALCFVLLAIALQVLSHRTAFQRGESFESKFKVFPEPFYIYIHSKVLSCPFSDHKVYTLVMTFFSVAVFLCRALILKYWQELGKK